MEIQINKEIKDYKESMFFGLSLRQFFFSAIAMVVAVGIYFGLRNYFNTETVSWMCILGAAPFAVLGFVNYHGLNAEQFAWVWFKSEILERGASLCKPTTVYYEYSKPIVDKKEGKRHNAKNSKQNSKAA